MRLWSHAMRRALCLLLSTRFGEWPSLLPRRAQVGAAVLEFTLAALPLLLAGFAAFEIGRWYIARHAVGYALMEAARAGSLAHANPRTIETTLERALLPLWGGDGTPSSDAMARARLQQRRLRLQDDHGIPLWQLAVVSPATAHFDDFGHVAGQEGRRYIRHSYQSEQHRQYEQLGYELGRGPRSGATIFEANILTLHLVYLHQPLLPGLSALLKRLPHSAEPAAHSSRAGEHPSMGADTNFIHRQTAFAAVGLKRAGMVPIRYQLALEMQSAPWEWPVGADSLEDPDAGAPGSTPASAAPAMPSLPVRLPRPTLSPVDVALPCTRPPCSPPVPRSPNTGAPGLGEASEPKHTLDLAPSPSDVACGVMLCCEG